MNNIFSLLIRKYYFLLFFLCACSSTFVIDDQKYMSFEGIGDDHSILIWSKSGIGFISLDGKWIIYPDSKIAFGLPFVEGIAQIVTKDTPINRVLLTKDGMQKKLSYHSSHGSHCDNNDNFSEGLFGMYQIYVDSCGKKTYKHGYVDSSGNWAIPPTYDGVGPFSNDLAPVYNKRWGYINKKNDLVIPYQYNEARSFSHNTTPSLAAVRKKNEVFFINQLGKRMIKDSYYLYFPTENYLLVSPQINQFQNGYALVCDSSTRLKIIDAEGHCVFMLPTQLYNEGFRLMSISPIPNKKDILILVFNAKTHLAGYINLEGKWIVKPQYFSIIPFNNGYAIGYKMGNNRPYTGTLLNVPINYCVINTDGEVVLESKACGEKLMNEYLKTLKRGKKNKK